MPLTEQDLTDLEIADSVGDFGRNSKVGDAVEELREARAVIAALRAGRVEVDESADHRVWRDMIDRVLAPPASASPDLLAPEERARRTRLAWWASLSNDERLALVGQCCTSCGAPDPSCRCGDDS